jgi:thiol-disulfide isomerase/thioredoxin
MSVSSYPPQPTRSKRPKILALAAALVPVALLSLSFLNPAQAQSSSSDPSPILGKSPLGSLSGATGWINTPSNKPLTAKDLKGKVVVVDFWTYSCINCLRAVPYIRAWEDKYKSSGLVVIGVHTPEFAFEKDGPNVQRAIDKFSINYPVALDSKQAIWNDFQNEYWPAHYFLDRQGKVRYAHFGEGKYDESEKWIQQLLAEGANKPMPPGLANQPMAEVKAQGVEAASDASQVKSPETYIGYSRAEQAAHFVSPGGLHQDMDQSYSLPDHPGLNQWGLAGKWADHEQTAQLKSPNGKILFRFHARDLHLVLGPSSASAKASKPIHFKVTIDGHAPGDDHGVDTDPQGNGAVTDYRLYQLIRQKGPIADHTFVIEFEDPGVQAFAFTFG